MKYIVTINDNNYEVEVESGKASIVGTDEVATIEVKQVVGSSPVEPNATAQTDKIAQSNPQIDGAGETLKCPMSGVILDIKVNQGDRVKEGDVLFILEAMKMENEIMAPIDGIVSQILVAKDAIVVTNDVLARIQS